MSAQKRWVAAWVGLAVGGAVVLGGAGSAVACLPAPEQIQDAYPEAGESVAPDVLLWLFGSGGGPEPTIELQDADGDVIDADMQQTYLASRFGVTRSLKPQLPLAEGTYTIRVQYASGGGSSFERSFEVDAQAAWPAPPAAPELSWFRETYAIATGNSCEFGDEHHRVTLSPVADAVVYRIELESGDSIYEQIGPMSDEEISHGITVGDIECVRAYAVRGDGTESVAAELCVPDKCYHYDVGQIPGEHGNTNWEGVDGCPGEDPGEGDADDSDVGMDAGDDVGDEPSDDAGDEPDIDGGEEPGNDVGEDPDAGHDPDTGVMDSGSDSDAGDSVAGGGCSSTGGSGGTGGLAMMLAALGALVWRRR